MTTTFDFDILSGDTDEGVEDVEAAAAVALGFSELNSSPFLFSLLYFVYVVLSRINYRSTEARK